MSGTLRGIGALAEAFSNLSSGFRAVSNLFTRLPTAIQDAVLITRTCRAANFAFHSYEFTRLALYFRKEKERVITAVHLIKVSAELVEDVALVVTGLKMFGLISIKVAAVASYVSFGALVVQGISIGIDAFRIHQLRGELRKLRERAPLDFSRARRISFQALYGKKGSELRLKADTPDFRAHLQKRIKSAITLRSLAILVSIIAITAASILLFAPTPAAPAAWALLATAALISVGLIALRELHRYKLNKEFNALPNRVELHTEDLLKQNHGRAEVFDFEAAREENHIFVQRQRRANPFLAPVAA